MNIRRLRPELFCLAIRTPTCNIQMKQKMVENQIKPSMSATVCYLGQKMHFCEVGRAHFWNFYTLKKSILLKKSISRNFLLKKFREIDFTLDFF